MVTSYPLRAILCNPDATGNIAKWAAELAEFELDFVLFHAVKSQVLADFIVDRTPSASPPGGQDDNELEPRAPVVTGLFSLMALRISRGRRGGSTPRFAWGPDQVHGAPRLQGNQQHGRV
jgi:hypothetical protein